MDDLVCPNCHRDGDLSGERRGELIRITCATCNLTWDRDPSPRCKTCGNRDVRVAPKAVWERVRGNQIITVALTTVHLCPTCDPDTLRAWLNSGTPIAPDENPAAGLK